VQIDLDLKKRHFPVFAPPSGMTDVDYLRQKCVEGAEVAVRRQPVAGGARPAGIRAVGHQPHGLCQLLPDRVGLRPVRPGKRDPGTGPRLGVRGDRGVPPGLKQRLSAEYDLLFERFLDPNRAEAPDIDIDFCRDRRELVLNYVKEKYGTDNVAQIGTFGTLGAKAVIRDVARALAVSLDRPTKSAKFVPTGPTSSWPAPSKRAPT